MSDLVAIDYRALGDLELDTDDEPGTELELREPAGELASKDRQKRRARGEGGISQRADGLYVAKVELPPDPVTGKRRQKRVTSMDHDAVVRKLNRLKRDLMDNGDLPTSSPTVEQWMRTWHRTVLRADTPRTIEAYRSTMEQHIIPVIGKLKLERLGPDDVRRVHARIIDGKKLSATTARRAHAVLSLALKAAEREGKVFRNVAKLVDPPRGQGKELAALNVDQAIQVLAHVQDQRLGSRWAAALLTGARQGELLGLEMDRVDFDMNIIDLSWQLVTVQNHHGCGKPIGQDEKGKPLYPCGFKIPSKCPKATRDLPASWERRHLTGRTYLARPKSDAGWRYVALVEPLRSILQRRIEEAANEPNPFGLVWTADAKMSQNGPASRELPLDGMPLDAPRDNMRWHAILKEAGVPDVRLHDARHTVVDLLYDLDVPESTIQDIVGHSVVMVTRKYRTRRTLAQRKPMVEAMKALGGRLTVKLGTVTATPLGSEGAGQ